MLQSTGRPYVCWRCITARASPTPVARGSRLAPLGHSLSQVSRLHVSPTFAKQGRGQDPDFSKAELQAIRNASDIRERLRAWEAENHVPSRRLLQDGQVQVMPLSNFLTRPDTLPGSTDAFDSDNFIGTSSAGLGKTNRALFDGDQLADLRGATSALLPGDLVETRYGSGRMPVLAICLGTHFGLQYFYINTGEVVVEQAIPTLFTVTGFVDPAMFAPIVAILPEEEPVKRPRNVLAHRKNPEALAAASRLQDKLTKFRGEMNAFYNSQPQLEEARTFLVHAKDTQYLTLEEVADRLLPEYLKVDGKFPPHALYAAHSALRRDNWAFRPLSFKWHRRNYVYEVRPKSDLKILKNIEDQVRDLTVAAALRNNPAVSESLLAMNPMGAFIIKAREVIQESRKTREWSPHGMIGPSKAEPGKDKVAPPKWTKQDLECIRFMELWSCHRIVPGASQLESIGSTILRLSNMYTESDWVGHWVGFTFLQEIGWIPPYDIPARYEYRFPHAEVRRGDLIKEPVDVEEALRPDVAAGHRRDWGETTVFCVDSEQTEDVDDGFSIERTETPGEYWIHIHIADPAASIDPKSKLAKQLEKAPSSLYLPGFPSKMMPQDLEKKFSLDPGQPALTFSAKVNERGVILDHKVEPGILKKVFHVPKDEVAAVLPGLKTQPNPEADVFSVGTPPEPHRPAKRITRAADLSQQDRDDLCLLHRLCTALKHRRVANSQLPPFQRYTISPEVSLDSVVPIANPENPRASRAWEDDPYIRFSMTTQSEADRLVERLMHTCGEVAARWCKARNIPIPYSTQPEAARNKAELDAFRRQHIDPLAAQGKPIPLELMFHVFQLLGTSELATDPAHFYSVGVDAYAKASSPLRRFPDLVVHWQIHAALARERGQGKSLVGANCSEVDFLPWTRPALARALPMIQALQRQIKQVDNRDGPKQWILQALLRAWRFGEAPIPKTFTFVVDGLYPFGLRGRLASFWDLSASVDLTRLGDVARMSEISVDDLFEVEIRDINAVTGQIGLLPLRRLNADGTPREKAA